MSGEWQCPYCKNWWPKRYPACTHIALQRELGPDRVWRTILGAEPEIWTAERKPEYPTRPEQPLTGDAAEGSNG